MYFVQESASNALKSMLPTGRFLKKESGGYQIQITWGSIRVTSDCKFTPYMVYFSPEHRELMRTQIKAMVRKLAEEIIKEDN